MVERSVVFKMFRRTCLVLVMIAKGESLFCIYFSRWRLLELVQFPFPCWFLGGHTQIVQIQWLGCLCMRCWWATVFYAMEAYIKGLLEEFRNAQFAALHVPRCFKKKTATMIPNVWTFRRVSQNDFDDFAWPFSSFQAIQPRTSTEGLSLQDAKRLLQVLPGSCTFPTWRFQGFWAW